MVRGMLGKLVGRSLSVAGKWQQQQLRRLNIHEYQVYYFASLHFFPSHIMLFLLRKSHCRCAYSAYDVCESQF